MELKTEKYKGVTIDYTIDEEGGFRAKGAGNYSFKDSFGRGWDTLKECEMDIKRKVDKFLESTPKTYEELGNSIRKSMVWSTYEDFDFDHDLLKIIIEKFIRYTNEQ